MQVQQPVVLYKLRSNDRTQFLVDRRTISMIGRLDNLFLTAGLDLIPPEQLRPIRLDMSATVLRKVIGWCDRHKYDVPYDDDMPLLPDWDAAFLTVRHSVLFEIIRAARDFDVPGLFAMCCQVVQQNPQEIIAGLLDDDDEAAQARRRRHLTAAAA